VKIFKQKYFVCHKFYWKGLTKFLYQNESSLFEFHIQNNLNQSPKLNFPFNLAEWAKPLSPSFPSLHWVAWAERSEWAAKQLGQLLREREKYVAGLYGDLGPGKRIEMRE
jgi:hypothetical protein